MDEQKPRCAEVAKAIVEYFRQECAISTSDGIEITSEGLAKVIGSSQSVVSSHIKRLVEHKILTVKIGRFVAGNNRPKFLALEEGHEAGDEWRKIYYGGRQASTRNENVAPRPILPSEIIKQKSTNDKYAELLRVHLQLVDSHKELQQKYLCVQRERNDAIAKAEKLATQNEEMRNDLKLEAEAAHQSQETVTQLEFQLREAVSQMASNNRRIAKNDETRPAFAASTR